MKKSKSSLRKIALSIAVASVMTCCGATAILTGCNKDNNTPSGNEQSLPVTVTIAQTANGTVTPDKTSYVSGDTVTLTITPATGYELGSVIVGETDKTASVRNGILVLSNVTENVTVTTVFNARTAATVSATVKENKGGSVSLSATSAYVGDNVTLTLAPEAGYEVISVKVNGAEKVGDLNGGNALTLTVTEATTNIEVEYYALPIAANITCNEYGSAQITDKKDNYSIGDNIEVVFNPDNYCKIVSVLVNGEERISELNENKLIITVTAIGNINIAAIFDVTPVPCEFGVSATRYGKAYDINGVNALLEHKTQDRKYNVSVNADGKIQAEFVPGDYTLTVAGCMPVDVTVTDEGVSTDKNVIYQMFDENNKSGNVDVSVADTVTLKSAYAWITSADTFSGDVLFTTKLKHSSATTYFAVGLIGSSSNKMIAITSEGNSEKLHFKKYGDVLFGGAKFIYDGEYSVNLNSAEQAAFTGNGLTLKIARKGDLLCLIANNGTTDRLLESWDVKDLASQGLKFGMCTFGGAEYTFNVSVGQNESEIGELLNSEVTVASGITNGTVTIDRQDGKYYLGETVTITVDPNDSGDDNIVYILKSLTVGDIDVTDKVANGVCKVKVTDKTLQVTAEFEQVTYASISVKVSGLKYGTAQTIDKVWLSSANYARTQHNLTEGVLSVNRLIEGEYTIEADGYLPVKVNVVKAATYKDIALNYQIFNENHKDGNVDVSTANSVTLNSAYAWITSKDSFDGDVMFTTTLKHTGSANYFAVAFLGEKNTFASVTATDNASVIRLTGYGEGALWSNCQKLDTTEPSFTLTQDEQTAYKAGGLTLTITRKGNVLCIFISNGSNSRLLCSYDVTAYAGQKMEFGMCTFGNTAYTFPVTVTQKAGEIDAVVSSTVSANIQGTAGGTVALDNQDGRYNIGGRVTVTVTKPDDANENTVYTVKTFTVNGEDKKSELTATNGGFTYEFTVTEKTVNIIVELEKTEYANLSVNIKGLKYGVEQDITSVTLKNATAGYEEIKSLTDGVLTVEHLIPGDYTIEADGYIAAKVTVEKDATYNGIVLNYQIFDENQHGSIDINTAQSTYQVKSWDVIKLKDTFTGDFVYTVSVQHRNEGGSNRLYMLARFEGNSVLCIGANNDNWHGIHCMDVGANAVFGGEASDYTYIDTWTGMALTDAEWTADQNGKLMLKLVRKGNNVYLIVGHTDESGNYSERLFRSWQGEQYAKAVDFGYVNTTNSAFETPINVSCKTEDIEALVGNKNLDVSVKFMKYGAEQTNITSVKLNDADYTLTDGKLVVNNLPMGIYTLTAEGYAPQTINLLDTKDIVLQYELIGTVKGGTVDQSNLSSGYVTASSWGGATLKEAINGDFVYTFGLKSADNKIYGSLCFMDDAGNTMMSFGVEGNQTDKICAYKAGDGALWTATFLSDNKSYALNADEQMALTAGNILVKLVKNNDKLYVFISQNGNDRLVDTFDIADHASKSVEFGLYNISGSSVNMALSLDTTQAAVDAMVAKVTA